MSKNKNVLAKALDSLSPTEIVELGSMVKQAGAYVLSTKLKEQPAYKACESHKEVMAKFLSSPDAAVTVQKSYAEWEKKQKAERATKTAARNIAKALHAGADFPTDTLPAEMQAAIGDELEKLKNN